MYDKSKLSAREIWFLQLTLTQKVREKVLCLIDENYTFASIINFIQSNYDIYKNIQKSYEIFLQNQNFSQIITREQIEFLRSNQLSLHAPLALEYKGNRNILSKKLIGIVGSRYPIYYGRLQAQRFAKELSSLGYGVISGGAIGIDSIANFQALHSQKGGSVCVIGNGVKFPYPRSNQKLFLKLQNSNNGLLLSEFESNETAKKWNFPKRNLTIAELCDFLLVIEATQISGSLMTARFARECGKPIGALPGNVQNPNTSGCHLLIQNGAYCIQNPLDILTHLYTPQK